MFNILIAIVGAATLTALYLCVAYGFVAVVAAAGPLVGATAEVGTMLRVALVGAAALFPVAAGLCLYWFSPGSVRGETVSVLRDRYSGEAAERTPRVSPQSESPTAETNPTGEAMGTGADRRTGPSPADAEADDRPAATPERASDGSDDDRREIAAGGPEPLENDAH